MFKKIAIADRGEIACRVIRTAGSMGIHGCGLFGPDPRTSHVQRFDKPRLTAMRATERIKAAAA
ncbi:MAG TPA: biotin carboxylase N-terminal domain-containing protein [Allosphingosinicella sp.]|nr:biotin carboxylase N-terminal domain-containing protein [Allosphingosinicella sp.]